MSNWRNNRTATVPVEISLSVLLKQSRMTSRMWPDSQSACVFFLAALCLARAQNSSRRLDETLADRADVDYVTKCSWNCTIAESDLTDEIKSTIVTNGVIRFEVRYEKKIGEKCINQTSGNPSENVTENWQIWLVNNHRQPKLASLQTAVENLNAL